jgi:rSAM/selenodomain-associated transferase 2
MNAGAAAARGDVLWFLHADTVPDSDAGETVLAALAASGRDWGRFDVRLSGHHPLLRMVETLMNLRSRFTGIATGDQGMFVRRTSFQAAGAFPDIPLMEDIALSRQLRRSGRPVCVRNRLKTSSRRWEARGVLCTIALMWWLRLAYFLGADPRRLARWYRA